MKYALSVLLTAALLIGQAAPVLAVTATEQAPPPILSAQPTAPDDSIDDGFTQPPDSLPTTPPEPTIPALIGSAEAWYPYTMAFTVTQGSDAQALADKLAAWCFTLWCYDKKGTEYDFSLPIRWDLSAVDIATVGVYAAVGTLEAPEGYAFTEEFVHPDISIPVSVQAEGKPDINCFFAGRWNFVFPWVAPPGVNEGLRVWMSKEEGEWTEISSEDSVYYDASGLTLQTSLFEDGHSYRIQVDYTGGSTGILEILYDDSPVIKNYSGGDRDGNDHVDEDTQPPIIQPPPDTLPPTITTPPTGGNDDEEGNEPPTDPVPPATATPTVTPIAPTPTVTPIAPTPTVPPTAPTPTVSPTAPTATVTPAAPPADEGYERVEDDTITISGARLLWLQQDQRESVPFGWNDVSVELSTDFLLGIVSHPEDLLSLTLKSESNNGFSISLLARGEEIHALEKTTVQLPLPKPRGDYALYLSDTLLDTPVTYREGYARFTIEETGTYRLEELLQAATVPAQPEPTPSPEQTVSAPPLPPPGKSDFVPAAVAVVVCLGGIFLFLRRKRP